MDKAISFQINSEVLNNVRDARIGFDRHQVAESRYLHPPERHSRADHRHGVADFTGLLAGYPEIGKLLAYTRGDQYRQAQTIQARNIPAAVAKRDPDQIFNEM